MEFVLILFYERFAYRELKMIAINFSRTELELLVRAIDVAVPTVWPTGDDRLRVQVLKKQLEKAIADLRSQGWQGERQ